MATRDLTIRVSVIEGDKARQELTLTGEEGQKALEKIREATKPVNDNLKLVNATVEEAKNAFEGFAEHAGAVGRVLGEMGPIGAAVAVTLGAVAYAIQTASRKRRNSSRRNASWMPCWPRPVNRPGNRRRS